jgi:hypothetical protein
MNIMKRPLTILASIAVALSVPGAVLAATNCDSQPVPAFSCPTGYSIMCIPTGGDHWGCGKESAGGAIEETGPVQARPTESPAITEPATTTTAPTETSIAQPTAQPSSAPVAPTAAPKPTMMAQAQPVPATTSDETAEPAVEPPALEDVQEFMENVAEEVPSSLQPVLSAIAGTLGVVIAFLGIWEWLKRVKEKKTGKCGRCGETTEEKCGRCEGSGKIDEEYEVTVKCTHCKGSGIDPCHHCSGTGKMSLPNPPQSEAELEGWPPCDFCGGSGVKKIGAGRDWGEANDAVKNGQFACCFCHGKKSETVKMKRQVPCPDCKGSGKK